ncbi:MAG: Asp-tRNA(Asn)/Glu-tRNA(Gln) amidotransferase subunit GatC [Bacilli bacterium]|nr:Asp-tRNA(Asn)/Glu-tRNA(Gln) amidotransferase subunit GatC [Bacilli bacterium]
MEMLNKNDVYHVANLAKLALDEEDAEKYHGQLNDILTEIEKIETVDIKEQDIMISSSNNTNRFSNGSTTHISKDEVLARASRTNGDFIVVSSVFND